MTTIYVDNAATTKTSRTAIEAMLPYIDKIYGNPSSLHSVGQAAANALRKAREKEAAEGSRLRAQRNNIYLRRQRGR